MRYETYGSQGVQTTGSSTTIDALLPHIYTDLGINEDDVIGKPTEFPRDSDGPRPPMLGSRRAQVQVRVGDRFERLRPVSGNPVARGTTYIVREVEDSYITLDRSDGETAYWETSDLEKDLANGVIKQTANDFPRPPMIGKKS